MDNGRKDKNAVTRREALGLFAAGAVGATAATTVPVDVLPNAISTAAEAVGAVAPVDATDIARVAVSFVQKSSKYKSSCVHCLKAADKFISGGEADYSGRDMLGYRFYDMPEEHMRFDFLKPVTVSEFKNDTGSVRSGFGNDAAIFDKAITRLEGKISPEQAGEMSLHELVDWTIHFAMQQWYDSAKTNKTNTQIAQEYADSQFQRMIDTRQEGSDYFINPESAVYKHKVFTRYIRNELNDSSLAGAIENALHQRAEGNNKEYKRQQKEKYKQEQTQRQQRIESAEDINVRCVGVDRDQMTFQIHIQQDDEELQALCMHHFGVDITDTSHTQMTRGKNGARSFSNDVTLKTSHPALQIGLYEKDARPVAVNGKNTDAKPSWHSLIDNAHWQGRVASLQEWIGRG